MGIKVHNNLLFKFKRMEDIYIFKNKLSYLLQNCFYSLQEFVSNNKRQYFGIFELVAIWYASI
jgi:hypothetical protein